MTLQELQMYFFYLYGRRNSIYLDSRQSRINLLSLAIADLQEAIRKEYGLEIIGTALVRIVSRIFCLAGSFYLFSIVEYLTRKYPSNFCSYCQQFPCRCLEHRPSAKIGEINTVQLKWSLSDWCNHFKSIYGERNKQKGIENVLNRLFKEIAELQSLQCVIVQKDIPLSMIEEKFGFELADALAWTIAVANFYDLDLEHYLCNRYGQGCWNCKKIPCECTSFNFEPVKWKL